jgi:hypothetical protein
MEGEAQLGFRVETEEPAGRPSRSNQTASAEPLFRKQWALIVVATTLLLPAVFVLGFYGKAQGLSEEKHETSHVAHAFIASPGRHGNQHAFIESRHGSQPFLSMVSKTGADDKDAPSSTDLSRRSFVGGALLGGTTLGTLPAMAVDDRQGVILDALEFLDEGFKMFEGNYTDPDGGIIRDISIKPTGIAGFRLAEVKSVGGDGEPTTLPAMVGIVNGRQQILIDFSAKGGPRDYPAVLETVNGKTGLLFLKDNQFWPKEVAKNDSKKGGSKKAKKAKKAKPEGV